MCLDTDILAHNRLKKCLLYLERICVVLQKNKITKEKKVIMYCIAIYSTFLSTFIHSLFNHDVGN